MRLADHAKEILIAPAGPPVRRIEEIKPLKILHTPAGETVFDMGQNMVGWVRLKVRGPAGTTVRLQHAEVLDKKGNFWLFVCSGPSRSKYGGGCTHSEMQYYLKQMGAFNADQLDGDTSSTMAVRHTLGGSVFRVDKTNSFYQRSVPNYLALM